MSIARDARRAIKEGPAAIAERQRTRLAEIVTYARAHSPYYRELCRDLPPRVDGPLLLPLTSKKPLMARFDDWVTDRDVTRDRMEGFIADPDLVGKRFLGRYLVATTSGTSGVRGLLTDNKAEGVTIERAEEPPQQGPGGKYRRVVPLATSPST